ncbi:DoxX family protein [Corynebacterium pyruviciproducens]|uniref:DoxX family protein n=1 Tax=Corynebacterium pyruviciproducens TaxID=598660 RepID=A0AAF0YPM5_9CORY|nr:DoxX family protein [Corynebacterium pyruviciproducens]MDH4658012.1 DoxX family protein [Corynebacterium pyruviciproducens]MDK6565106.1 DoxX family protein [Corynebacterium pyruviciproducens]MDK7213949.1 DoxX family protein [Corynebacterium pyruviciproducens]WOT01097.1 DoxX family protein [Corynebacterium pyruviciproducens]
MDTNEKNTKPDKASSVDFGAEVPTYDASKDARTEVFSTTPKADAVASDLKTEVFSTPNKSGLAGLAGRAKPQVISPKQDSAQTEVLDSTGTSYDDADFAPTAQTEAVFTSQPAQADTETRFSPVSSFAGTSAAATTVSPGVPPVGAPEPGYATVAEAPGADAVAVEEPEDPRRGTMDFGLLLLRIVLGGYLIFEALKVFFNLGGSEGLAGVKEAFAAYAYPTALAIVVPTLALTAGVFILLGLLTPVAAAVAVIATGFGALHALVQYDTTSLFAVDNAVILALILLGLALVVQFTGPGKIALDFSRSWAKRPLASSWIWCIVGIVAAGAMWWFGTGINPLG